jgi:hypothetical protein
MMRKVVLYELLSLDGVAERPINFFLDFDDAMRENLQRLIADQDVVLLGRRTYDDWAEDWPGSDMEPFASFINKVRKYTSPQARSRNHGRTARSSMLALHINRPVAPVRARYSPPDPVCRLTVIIGPSRAANQRRLKRRVHQDQARLPRWAWSTSTTSYSKARRRGWG